MRTRPRSGRRMHDPQTGREQWFEKENYKQKLIIQLWKACPSFYRQSEFSTRMYRVCLNAAIDILRKKKNRPDILPPNLQSADHIPGTKKEAGSGREKPFRAINKLSAVDKAINTLYPEAYSQKETAEAIGISESTTGVKINRIKPEIIKTANNGNT